MIEGSDCFVVDNAPGNKVHHPFIDDPLHDIWTSDGIARFNSIVRPAESTASYKCNSSDRGNLPDA